MTTTIQPGDRVSFTDPRNGRVQYGRAVRLDANHYFATQHGHRMWFVRWDRGSVGSGWREDDLRRA